MKELSSIVQRFASSEDDTGALPMPSRIISANPTGNNSRFAESEHTSHQVSQHGDDLLVQIAKHFRKKVLKMWEKKLEAERNCFSFGGSSLKQSIGSSLNEGSLRDKLKYEDIEALYFNAVESDLPFKVPFPVLSAG